MGLFSNLSGDLGKALKNIQKFNVLKFDNTMILEKHNAIQKILNSMLVKPSNWEDECIFNVIKQGSRFESYVINIANDEDINNGFYAQKIDLFFIFV